MDRIPNERVEKLLVSKNYESYLQLIREMKGLRNLEFSLTEKNHIINVRWTREFFSKIFTDKKARKFRIWNKTSFPFSPIEDMFAGSSVQIIFHFHIPECEMLQKIIVETQTTIYPKDEETSQLHYNAVKALLKIIGKQSQPIRINERMISIFGHKENFNFATRFVSWGSKEWPFTFERAMVNWEAHVNSAEADIVLEVDFLTDLAKIETASWAPDGKMRIPFDDLTFGIDLQNVLNEEIYPVLTPLNNETNCLEISSEELEEKSFVELYK